MEKYGELEQYIRSQEPDPDISYLVLFFRNLILGETTPPPKTASCISTKSSCRERIARTHNGIVKQ
jgi:hypothetical protein